MNSRILGSRKIKLINIVERTFEQLAKKGIDGSVILKKHKVFSFNDFYKVQTKKFSGMISDLKELL